MQDPDSSRITGMQKKIALASRLVSVINFGPDVSRAVEFVVSDIKNTFGFDAVGIRLRSKEDFPYAAQEGFSPDFLAEENSLLPRGGTVAVLKDSTGNILPECACGLALSGRTNPENPAFTPGGSILINRLKCMKPAERVSLCMDKREKCVLNFGSMALVPIRDGNKILGLLQVNDKAGNAFTQEMVSFFEDIASLLGVLIRARDEREKYKTLFETVKTAILIGDARSGLILDANKEAELLFGRSRGELIGLHRVSLHPAEKAEYYSREFNRQDEEEKTLNFEAIIVDGKGANIAVHMSSSMYTADGSRKILTAFRVQSEAGKTEEAERRENRKKIPFFAMFR